MDFDLPPLKSVPEYAYDALVAQIREFQEGLPDDMEVGIVTNTVGMTLHIERLWLADQIVVLDGTDGEGRKARLLQHYTQINVQMVAVNKLQSEARRIGF